MFRANNSFALNFFVFFFFLVEIKLNWEMKEGEISFNKISGSCKSSSIPFRRKKVEGKNYVIGKSLSRFFLAVIFRCLSSSSFSLNSVNLELDSSQFPRSYEARIAYLNPKQRVPNKQSSLIFTGSGSKAKTLCYRCGNDFRLRTLIH